MLQFLQTLQISLFAITLLGVFSLGILILVKRILTFHRRIFLVIFLPLLAANPLALLEELALPGGNASLDWRLGLILGVDLALAAAGYFFLRGWLVYGLSALETEAALKAWCEENGYTLDSQPMERKMFWGGNRLELRLTVSQESQHRTLWLMASGSETRLEGEDSESRTFLRQMLPALQRVEKPYQIQDHLTGALYIVMTLVLAVLVWIFFFEPRLILID